MYTHAANASVAFARHRTQDPKAAGRMTQEKTSKHNNNNENNNNNTTTTTTNNNNHLLLSNGARSAPKS